MVKTLPSNTGGAGSSPGQGAKIPYASQPRNQNIKQKQYCNKFNKDFKNGPNLKTKKILKQNPTEIQVLPRDFKAAGESFTSRLPDVITAKLLKLSFAAFMISSFSYKI